MGWHTMTIEVGLLLDAHGGDKERDHDKLAEDLLEKITKVTEEEKYQDIVMDVRLHG